MIEVRRQVLSCRRCGLHRVGHGPVPFRGPVPARLAMVGEAPGPVEDEQGAPFVGPSGKLMDELFIASGIDPAGVFVCNTVSCYPKRTPDGDEREACRPNLLAQLAIASPRFILLLGGVALTAFKGMNESMGFWCDRVFPWEHPETGRRSFVWPTYHPAAALRSGRYRTRLQASVSALGARLGSEQGDLGPEPWWGR